MKNNYGIFHMCRAGAFFVKVFPAIALFIFFAQTQLYAQQTIGGRTVSGIVKDSTGNTLPGVSVAAKGTSVRTATDAGGKFTMNVPAATTTLVFTYIGMQTREVALGTQTVYNITLQSASNQLEEVTVYTGYMTQRKADLTGAVSVVKREDFAKNPSANVMRSVQGKVPGLNITTDGNPAEGVRIQVRGITSLNSAPPLIVLDGQPVNLNLRDINPNDIETIQVLKDASSASIYGSRAAGGVILINTKKGGKGQASISYDSYVGLQKIRAVPNMLNAEQYGRGLWQSVVNEGIDPSTIRIYNYDWTRNADGIAVLNSVTPVQWLNDTRTMPSSNTNWFEAGTRTGVQQNHQVTITSGGDKLSSMFSLNYYNNQGTQITSLFRRYSARFNNDYQLVKDRLSVGETLTMTNLKIRDVNSIYQMLVMPPNIPVRDNLGGWGGSAMNLGMDDFNNPIRQLDIAADNRPNFLKAIGSAYANLKILDNLSLRTQYGVDFNMWNERYIDRAWQEAGGRSYSIDGVRQIDWQNLGRTWTNTLTYNLKLQDHQIDLLGGTETYHYEYEDVNSYRDNIEIDDRDYGYVGAATGDRREQFGGGDERKLLSFFGKVNYSYGSKYLLSATLRRDGASNFGANNRYATFPAVSGGWRISQEPFLRNVKAINDLKIRASWGQNGNQAPLDLGRLYNIYVADFNGTSYPIAGNPSGSIPGGLRRSRLGNPDLKWETTTQTNIGADFSFLSNRLNGSIDWFNKKTTDMLFEPPYPAALGEGGYRFINAGNMNNKGLELVLSWASKPGNGFNYTITGNLASYRNKVISVPDNFRFVLGGNGLLDDIVGKPRNSFYGLVADGIFKSQAEVDNSAQQPGKAVGRIRYRDLDGDGVINDTYDRTFLGTADPKYMAGLNFSASYKNFDMMVFVQGVFGNVVYNSWKESSDFWNIGIQKDRNHPTRILDAWSPLNPNSDIPAMSSGNSNGELRLSSYFLENGSFIKLRTLDIGYTLPKKITDKMSMSRLRIYVTAQNLVNLKKWWGKDRFTIGDPEVPGATNFGDLTAVPGLPTGSQAYPMPVTALLGLNVTF